MLQVTRLEKNKGTNPSLPHPHPRIRRPPQATPSGCGQKEQHDGGR